MKKLVLSVLLVLALSSCGYHSLMSNSIKFQVIDTLEIHSENNPFVQTNYSVLIKMDSSYYSAKMTRFGDLYEINRKLDNIKKLSK